MATKHRACCGRLHGKITTLKGELGRAAKALVRADEKGRPLGPYLESVEDAKRVLKMAEDNLETHEAEHAGEPE